MRILILIVFCIIQVPFLFAVEVKLKDIARVQGIRDNQISGYGIVTGLAGTGDSKNAVTTESMKNYLKNQGLSTSGNQALIRNVASVLVTATIPSTAKPGDKIDVTISSIGDAKSLEGGVLLQSPLKAANNEVIAVANGIISFGGKDTTYNRAALLGKTSTKTVGTIINGAIVEKEISNDFFNTRKYRIVLESQNFATLDKVQKAIKEKTKLETAVISPTEVEVTIPDEADPVPYLSTLENIGVEPETKAKVVINERTGTIVMGANVSVDEVAVSKQGISVYVAATKKKDDSGSNQNVIKLEESATVADVVNALNKIGASTKDIIAILEGLKKAGALHAEVIVQ